VRLRPILAVVSILFASVCAYGDTLATVTGGTTPIAISLYVGQSFSVFGSGNYNDISFNFYTPGEDPYAIGTGYLFSAPYGGTPTGLSSAAPGYLGSAIASGNTYSFDSSVILSAGNSYYFYEDALVPEGTIVGGPASSNLYYAAYGPNELFGPGVSGTSNFLVTGDLTLGSVAATPEPSSLILLTSGVLGSLMVLRQKRGRNA
jgi:PEP-CTERM motif